MKKLAYLFSLTLATSALAETSSIKDQLSEALYAESVARTPVKAAEMYEKIVESFRSAGSPAEQRAHAGAALFRLAEIRSEEGSEEEAEKLYREFIERFPDQKRELALAKAKLGISGPPSRQKLTKVTGDEEGDEDPELSENVLRDRWHFTRTMRQDELVLTTFEVKHQEGYANEGLPPAFKVNTLHHAPSGKFSEWFSRTHVYFTREELKKMYEENLEKGRDTYHGHDRENLIYGFGQSYVVPEGLYYSGGGWGDASMAFFFTNEYASRDKENGSGEYEEVKATKWLTVKLSFKPISWDDARRMAMPLKLELPEMGDEAWSITLPPSPAELEPAGGQDFSKQSR